MGVNLFFFIYIYFSRVKLFKGAKMKFYKWEAFLNEGQTGDTYIQGGCSEAPLGTETIYIKHNGYIITVVEEGGGEMFDTETVLIGREFEN